MQTIFPNYLFFFKFLYFERKIFGLSLKTFRRVCNHSILCIFMNVLRKNKKGILRKKNNFYTILGDCEENFGVLVNTAYTETIGSLCRPFFWNICFFYQFCTLSSIFSDFQWKLFGEVVITAFVVSKGTFWEKIKTWFFEKRKYFIPFSETERKTSAWWWTRYTVRQWELYADLFSELFVFFTIFVLWAQIFRTFVENFSASL